VAATTCGEIAGFGVPAGTVALAGGALDRPGGLLLMVLAGAGEGAVLGWAQTRVLRRELPGLSSGDWTVRTAAAASLAWAIGMAPSALRDALPDLSPVVQVAAAGAAGVVLLTSIGAAQWTVLRRHVSRAGGWVGWTALGWLTGLAVFLAVATPLWQAGQSTAQVLAIGALAGCLMAATMAVVTGRGLIMLLRASDLGGADPG
jgi:Ca2+-transporting ATPase